MSILESLQHSKQNQIYANKLKLKPCTHCNSERFVIKETANANGLICYPYFCLDCGARSPIVEKKVVAFKIGFVGINNDRRL